MNRRGTLVAGVAIAAAAVGAGVAWQRRAAPGEDVERDLWRARFDRPAGGQLAFETLRGRPLLLNFWATWCPPCKIEIPWFIELQRQYADQGLVVVGVAMDDDTNKQKVVSEFASQMKIDYPILLGTDQVADQYGGVDALPTTFFIGRDGKIVRRVMGLAGHSEFEEAIQAALKEGQIAQTETVPMETAQAK